MSDQEPTADPTELPAEPGDDISEDPDKLLNRLLYRGVLPRYAFPTDVASFYVFDVENSSYGYAFEFAPSQQLSIALSEYAPGKEVWIAGKAFACGAVFSPFPDERYEAWMARRLYFECSECHYASTFERDEAFPGERRECPACGAANTFGKARWWFRPPGFAHPVFREAGTSADDQPPRSYATHAKLTAPTPADPTQWVTITDRLRMLHMRQHLLVTNRGPRQEGYSYCARCGLIEPSITKNGMVGAAHQKPYPHEKPSCDGGRGVAGIVLGTDFITDVLLVSLSVQPPLTLQPGLLATEMGLRTVSEALALAACSELELEPSELEAEFRPALTTAGKEGLEAEIYLYDTLPGGAGFTRKARDLGERLFVRALDILESCPDNCDASCYRCLRSYKNKLEHGYLDRHLGASLLRYVLQGDVPVVPAPRHEQCRNTLAADVTRQEIDGLSVELDAQITVAGIGQVHLPFVIKRNGKAVLCVEIASALAPDHSSNPTLQDLKECSRLTVSIVNELLIRKNLPDATRSVLRSAGIS